MGNVAFKHVLRDITNINLPSLTAEFGEQVFLPALYTHPMSSICIDANPFLVQSVTKS